MRILSCALAIALIAAPTAAKQPSFNIEDADTIDFIVYPAEMESRVPITPADLMAGAHHHIIRSDDVFFKYLRNRLSIKSERSFRGYSQDVRFALIGFRARAIAFSLFSDGAHFYTDHKKHDAEAWLNGMPVSLDYQFVDEMYDEAERRFGKITP